MALTTDEYLLLTLMEECAEIQQAASKIMRFGPHSTHPKLPLQITNIDHLHNELHDLKVILSMLNTSEALRIYYSEERLERVKAKKLHYLQVCKQIGTVQDA